MEGSSKTTDEYIAKFSGAVREKLVEMREIIKSVVPMAEERITYTIPSFYYNGTIVCFAATKKHVSLFPTASAIKAFAHELEGYKTLKMTIIFEFNKPLPQELIKKIVKFRLDENTSNMLQDQ